MGLNQLLEYIHPFPPLCQPILFAPLQLSSQKVNILRQKNIGGAFASPHPYAMAGIFKIFH